jgi:hypothetical protein
MLQALNKYMNIHCPIRTKAFELYDAKKFITPNQNELNKAKWKRDEIMAADGCPCEYDDVSKMYRITFYFEDNKVVYLKN